mgnify:CR=1 FL=1
MSAPVTVVVALVLILVAASAAAVIVDRSTLVGVALPHKVKSRNSEESCLSLNFASHEGSRGVVPSCWCL